MHTWLRRMTETKALTQAPPAPTALSSIVTSRSIDYSREVGDGLDSSVLLAPVLWIARTFPEARSRSIGVAAVVGASASRIIRSNG